MACSRFVTIQNLIRSNREIWEDVLQGHGHGAIDMSSEIGGVLVRQWHTILQRAGESLEVLEYSETVIEDKLRVAADLIVTASTPKHFKSLQAHSTDDYFLLDLWLGKETPKDCLMFVELNTDQCNWVGRKLDLKKPWHAAFVLALGYMRILDACLFVGMPSEAGGDREDTYQTMGPFASIMIFKANEALLFAKPKFESATGGKKGSTPPDTRWEKFALEAIKGISQADMNRRRYVSGVKEGEVRLGPLAAFIVTEIHDRCTNKRISKPAVSTIRSRLPKLLKQLGIPDNIKRKEM